MPNANTSIAVQSDSVAFNNSTNTEVDLGSKAKSLIIKTSAYVRIGFDTPANTSDFMLEASDRAVRIFPCEVTRLFLLGNSGSGTLYYIVSR